MKICSICGKNQVIARPGAKLCARCLVLAIERFFGDEFETKEEIDQALRDVGLDPDEVGRNGAEIAKRALNACNR